MSRRCLALALLLLTVPLAHADVRPPLSLHGYSKPDDVVAVGWEGRSTATDVEMPALRPLSGPKPGISYRARRNVLLTAVLFTIFATGAALLLPRRRPVLAAVAIGVLVALMLGAVHVWWTRQPASPTGGEGMVIQQPRFT